MVNLREELLNRDYYEIILKRYLQKELDLPQNYSTETYISMITSPTYKWGIPTQYLIPKDNGKFREIYSFQAQDSFMLKVINEILFAKCGYLINSNVYSYTKGIRTYNGCKSLQRGLRSNNNLIGYKLDLSNYFLSVDKREILSALDKLIEDDFGKSLLTKFFSINSYINNGIVYNKELSLMPGSAISSFFANYIPNEIDDYISKESFLYSRYGDDMIILCENKESLDTIYYNISKMYSDIGLKFNESKTETLTSDKPITFLGLTTTKQYIDISTKNFVKNKKFIKSVIKSTVKKGDIYSVKKCINRLNKTLLGNNEANILDNIPHSKFAFIFNNITIDKTVKELDFYVKDRLRQAYTGKNNSGNIAQLPNDKLLECGLLSFTQMYYLNKVGKQFLDNEVSIKNFNNTKPGSTKYRPILKNGLDSFPIVKVENNIDFSSLLYKLASNNMPILINNIPVYVEYLDFNLDTSEIKWDDTVFAVGNEVVVSSLKYLDNRTNTIYEIEFKDCKVKSTKTYPVKAELISKFIVSSYVDLYNMSDRRLKRSYSCKTYTRMYKFKDLMQLFVEDTLQYTIPFYIRKFIFNLYFYSHIVSGDLWVDIDYSVGSMIEVSNQSIGLVIKKAWLQNNITNVHLNPLNNTITSC